MAVPEVGSSIIDSLRYRSAVVRCMRYLRDADTPLEIMEKQEVDAAVDPPLLLIGAGAATYLGLYSVLRKAVPQLRARPIPLQALCCSCAGGVLLAGGLYRSHACILNILKRQDEVAGPLREPLRAQCGELLRPPSTAGQP
eukprot:TRINITY_DN90559_c0_g1_i1.p1 TRINITY_DN90559_c0_g1~~TRINITY_DN90559_c0_g1_i1.p1  ORF type:complete len:141 (-),score=11.64 TRINITY_DN90559_c0_g1_i1:285-707(-)